MQYLSKIEPNPFHERPSALGLLEGCCCKFHLQGESITFYHTIHACPPLTGWGLLPLSNHFMRVLWQWEAGKSGIPGTKSGDQDQSGKRIILFLKK